MNPRNFFDTSDIKFLKKSLFFDSMSLTDREMKRIGIGLLF